MMTILFVLLGLIAALIAFVQIDLFYWKPRDISRLLFALLDGRERYGLDLAKEARLTWTHHALYPRLADMEEEGLVVSRIDEAIDPEKLRARGGIPRRLYQITPAGIERFRKWLRKRR